MARKPKPPADDATAPAGTDPPAEADGTQLLPTLPDPPQPAADGHPPPRPAKVIGVAVGDGGRIEGCIWPRETTLAGQPVTAYSATVHKSSRGADGEARQTGSFRGSELPLVQYVLGCCAQWILDQRREEDPPF